MDCWSYFSEFRRRFNINSLICFQSLTPQNLQTNKNKPTKCDLNEKYDAEHLSMSMRHVHAFSVVPPRKHCCLTTAILEPHIIFLGSAAWGEAFKLSIFDEILKLLFFI